MITNSNKFATFSLLKVCFVAIIVCGLGLPRAIASEFPEEQTQNGGSEQQTLHQQIIDSLISIGHTDNQTMQHLDILTNRFGGRLAGSDAYQNAAMWCADRFTEWGLEVVMDKVMDLPVGFNRGPWSGRMVGKDGVGDMGLRFATPSHTSGTKGVQRGHVVFEPRTQEEFNRVKDRLKGAWVLVQTGQPLWPVNYSVQANEQRLSQRRYNESPNAGRVPNRANQPPQVGGTSVPFYKEMQDLGVLGLIQPSDLPITVLFDLWNYKTMTFETLPTVPDIRLSREQYLTISKRVKNGEQIELEFDIRNYFKPGPVPCHNVLGFIRGSELPNEYVMLGAHLDSFDASAGALDNGTGVAAVMEAARMIATSGAKPKRTIIFCLWTAEEYGLLGSKHWVESNGSKLPNISYYLNIDARPHIPSSIEVSRSMYADMVTVCGAANRIDAQFPIEVICRKEPINYQTMHRGSDHTHFALNNVPSVAFGISDPKGYGPDYAALWHTDSDNYQNVVPQYQEHYATVAAVVVYGMAQLDNLFSRVGLYTGEN